jgi:quercetin dioxygenase-like cupin family protein
VTGASADVDLRLGGAIRARRRRLGLTLVAVAAEAGLSHPFLSQLERGLARPSMRSLSAIAATLGTTAQVLMAEAELRASDADEASQADPASDAAPVTTAAQVSVNRAGSRSPGQAESPGVTVHALARGEGAMLPVEYVGAQPGFDEYLQHPGEEFVYVVQGQIEIDIEGEVHAAAAGDSLYYSGGLRHRWRSTGEGEVHVVVVQQNLPPIPRA